MSMTLPGFLARGGGVQPVDQQLFEFTPLAGPDGGLPQQLPESGATKPAEIAAPIGAAAIEGALGGESGINNPWIRLASIARDPTNPNAQTAQSVINYFSR